MAMTDIQTQALHPNLIWGVCVLLRLWDQMMWVLIRPKVVIYFQPDDGRMTETCSYVYISNILTYDSDAA
jgi:hypothetical protein